MKSLEAFLTYIPLRLYFEGKTLRTGYIDNNGTKTELTQHRLLGIF